MAGCTGCNARPWVPRHSSCTLPLTALPPARSPPQRAGSKAGASLGTRPRQEPLAPSCCQPRSPHSARADPKAGCQVKSPHAPLRKRFLLTLQRDTQLGSHWSFQCPPFAPLEYTVHRVYGTASASEKNIHFPISSKE